MFKHAKYPVLFLTGIVLFLWLSASPALAATRKCYTISSGNTPVYSNTALTSSYGTIFGSDELSVLNVTSKYSQVTYPTSKGSKTGYINTSAILWGTGGSSYKATSQITTYKRPGGASYGYISPNDSVMVLGKNNGYIQVKYPVSGGYKYAFIPESNGSALSGYGGSSSSGTTYYITTKAGLILRSGASTGSSKLATMPYGAAITVYSISGGWAQCSYSGKSGYCSSSYISTSKPATSTTYYVTTTSGLILRSSPSTSSSKILTMPYGAAITVSSISNGWAACSYNGRSGYCSSSYISTSKPSSGSSTLSYGLYHSSSAYISCGFDGYTTTRGRHEGIDIVYGQGRAVYNLVAGTVVRVASGYRGSNGLSTVAIYDSSSNKTVVYLHMCPYNVKAGQYIPKGQQIGTQDWRGISSQSGGHTHVEVRNGKTGYAAKSVNDYTLDNPNPTSYWNSKGYSVK